MLQILPNEEVHLPEKFHDIHNLTAYIYDQLTAILSTSGEYKQFLTSTTIAHNGCENNSLQELTTGETHILDWLASNSLNTELDTVLTKHITLSVLSDFLNFIYESLNCAKKAKFTVAYSLLRKPMTDELSILEQLLVDNSAFIKKFFYDGDPANYDPSSQKMKNGEQKLLTEKAVQQLSFDKLFSANFIYKLRYDKATPVGFNAVTNQALHIVTSDKNYKTDHQDLNFIFSAYDPKRYQQFCHHYYTNVPYLLLYATAVVDHILFQYIDNDNLNQERTIRAFQRFIGLDKYLSIYGERTITKLLEESLLFTCDKCAHEFAPSPADFDLFVSATVFLCPACLKPLDIDKDFNNALKKIVTLQLEEGESQT